jgi:hypothetical protein
MPRRGSYIAGLLSIGFGAALPVLTFFAQPSDRELTPFDVVADLSGAPTTATFTAHRNRSYSAFVAMKLPPGASEETSTTDCLLRDPTAGPDALCKIRGQLAVTATIADSNGSQTGLNDADPMTGYTTVGSTDVTATRTLGVFNAIAGHDYVVTAHFKSDDPAIRRLKPHLTAFINEPGIYAGMAVLHMIFLASLLIAATLLLTGAAIIAGIRKGRKNPEPA